MSKEYIIGDFANRRDLPPMTWNPDSKEATNQHALIVGKSGSGKTTLLKDLVLYLNSNNKHIYVFDIKGDLVFKDDNDEVIGNYIKFTAWDSQYGVNMYEFDLGVKTEELKKIIEHNEEPTEEQLFAIRNAGPKVQIKRIIELYKKNFFSALGAVQQNMLNNLFRDTYIYRGFDLKDYSTWLKPLPTLEDTIKIIETVKVCLSSKGSKLDNYSSTFIKNAKHFIIELKQLESTLKTEKSDDSIEPEREEELNILINEKNSKLRELFNEYVSEGKELFIADEVHMENNPYKWLQEHNINLEDYDFKNSLTTLEQLHSYLKNLLDAEVFNDNVPPVKPGLNVINISGLDKDIQRFFVDIWLGKVFRACKLRGDYKTLKDRKRGDKVDTYAVLDETETIAGDEKEKKDPFSYLNIIAKESRSIGFGLLVAAQSPKHFPHEFLRNFHLQVILEMNNSGNELDVAAKSFGVDLQLVNYTMQGFGNALVKKGAVYEKIKANACKKIEHLK